MTQSVKGVGSSSVVGASEEPERGRASCKKRTGKVWYNLQNCELVFLPFLEEMKGVPPVRSLLTPGLGIKNNAASTTGSYFVFDQ